MTSRAVSRKTRQPVSRSGKFGERAELTQELSVGLVGLMSSVPTSKLKPIKAALKTGRPWKAIGIIATEAKPAASDDDVILQALARGARIKEELIEKAGGLWRSKDAAAAIGISPQALHKRKEKGDLIAVVLSGGDLGYPAFQFESPAMLEGVATVLEGIGVDEPWARFTFMFLKLDELGGLTPVDAIRSGKVPDAALAARHYGEHGAS